MSEDETQDVTRLLAQAGAGNREAADRLLSVIYDELHRIAARQMQGQAPGHTLQATALVNEAYVRIFKDGDLEIRDRDHFLALASKAMRSILVDHARGKRRLKRTPPGERTLLEGLATEYGERAIDVLSLHEALTNLASFDPPLARLVELRFFGGVSMSEAARIVGMAPRTADREWKRARGWLRKELS